MKISILVMVVFVCSVVAINNPRRGGKASATVGADLFVRGKYLEFAVNPSGGLGSRPILSGRAYTGTTPPAYVHKAAGQTRLGVVVDYGMDGWNVGTPAKSGDAFLEGWDDVGWRLTWNGPTNGLEEFEQYPLMEADDDDADESFYKYRGCIKCSNGIRADGICDETVQDCTCNLETTASTYLDCPFRKWDMTTISINRTQDSQNKTTIVFVGDAIAKVFHNSTTGSLRETGEKIRVTKVMMHNYNDLHVIEHATLLNIGTIPLTDVSIIYHIVPTLENFQGYSSTNASLAFANHVSIPYQSTAGKTLVQARGQKFNMTVGLGTNDQDGRAWFQTANTWREAPVGRDLSNKIFNTDAKAQQGEHLSEDVIALGFKVASLPVGQQVTKSMFWAFSLSAIPNAFTQLEVAYSTGITSGAMTTGVTTELSTGITTGAVSTGEISTGEFTTGQTTGVTTELSTGITTGDISTGETTGVTTELSTGVTTGITTELSTGITSGDITTQAVSTGLTSGLITTGDVTSQDITTGDEVPVTTHAETTAVVPGPNQGTTGIEVPVTSGNPNVTVTSGKITGGETFVTTVDPDVVRVTTAEDAAVKERNVKIIASVFGVAGFILLVLCVGGVILAVRRMQKNPVV